MMNTRPRRRRAATQNILTDPSLYRALRETAGDADAQAELRPTAIRSLAKRMRSEQAEKIVDALLKRPELIPMDPPPGAKR